MCVTVNGKRRSNRQASNQPSIEGRSSIWQVSAVAAATERRIRAWCGGGLCYKDKPGDSHRSTIKVLTSDTEYSLTLFLYIRTRTDKLRFKGSYICCSCWTNCDMHVIFVDQSTRVWFIFMVMDMETNVGNLLPRVSGGSKVSCATFFLFHHLRHFFSDINPTSFHLLDMQL